MKSRSSTLLTAFAFGVALAALAPRLVKSLVGAGRGSSAAPTPPATSSEPVVERPAEAAEREEPQVTAEPPAAWPAPEQEPAAVAAAPAFPWLQASAEPSAPSVAPVPEPAAPAAWQPQTPPAGGWAAPPQAPGAWQPAPPAAQPMPGPLGGYIPSARPWAPPPAAPYAPPPAGAAPFSRGWAPPGTYTPPPMPTNGFPPNGAIYQPPSAPPLPPAAAVVAEPRPAVVTRTAPPLAPPVTEPEIQPLTDEELEQQNPPRSAARRWFGTATSIVGILLLLSVVATLAFVAIAPRLLGWQFVVVSGGSMEPTIHLGSVAVMDTKVQTKSLKAGDIIMFSDPAQPGRAVTHRIIEVKESGGTFVTRGDANKAADAATVPAQFVKGRYLFSIPAAGRFVRWMGTSQGYLVIILVPGVVIIAWELRSLSRNRNKPAGGARA